MSKHTTFVEPQSPWQADTEKLEALRSAVAAAESDLRHTKSRGAGFVEIERARQTLASAQRELEIAHREQQLERRKQQVGHNVAARRAALAAQREAREEEPIVSTVAALSRKIDETREHLATLRTDTKPTNGTPVKSKTPGACKKCGKVHGTTTANTKPAPLLFNGKQVKVERSLMGNFVALIR